MLIVVFQTCIIKNIFKKEKDKEKRQETIYSSREGKQKMNSKIEDYLKELGFKGKILRNLLQEIKNESDLENFQNFIINNDGKFRSNLQLAHQYIISLQEDSTYTKEEFVSDYSTSNDDRTKSKAVSKLFNSSSVNSLVLNKVEYLKNILTLEELYDKIVEYRNEYNPIVAVKLIELHTASEVYQEKIS